MRLELLIDNQVRADGRHKDPGDCLCFVLVTFSLLKIITNPPAGKVMLHQAVRKQL